MTGLTVVKGFNMTEMVNGEGQSFQNSSAQVPVNTPSSTPSQAPSDERVFKQSEVNDLIGRAKQEAIERYKRETSMSSHQYQQNVQGQQQYGNQPNYAYNQPHQAQPQYNGMSEGEYRKLAAEEAQRLRNEWMRDAQRSAEEQEAQRVAQDFIAKTSTGKEKYEDFEKVVSDVGYGNFPHIVQLANMMDNTDDVVYELSKNPTKIAAIQNLVDIALRNGVQPNLAFNEMKKLSESIKENSKAKNFRSPNEPLSQLRPGNAGTDGSGRLEVADYKRRYRV